MIFSSQPPVPDHEMNVRSVVDIRESMHGILYAGVPGVWRWSSGARAVVLSVLPGSEHGVRGFLRVAGGSVGGSLHMFKAGTESYAGIESYADVRIRSVSVKGSVNPLTVSDRDIYDNEHVPDRSSQLRRFHCTSVDFHPLKGAVSAFASGSRSSGVYDDNLVGSKTVTFPVDFETPGFFGGFVEAEGGFIADSVLMSPSFASTSWHGFLLFVLCSIVKEGYMVGTYTPRPVRTIADSDLALTDI